MADPPDNLPDKRPTDIAGEEIKEGDMIAYGHDSYSPGVAIGIIETIYPDPNTWRKNWKIRMFILNKDAVINLARGRETKNDKIIRRVCISVPGKVLKIDGPSDTDPEERLKSRHERWIAQTFEEANVSV